MRTFQTRMCIIVAGNGSGILQIVKASMLYVEKQWLGIFGQGFKIETFGSSTGTYLKELLLALFPLCLEGCDLKVVWLES